MQHPPDNGQPQQPTPPPGQYPMQGPPQFPQYPQQPPPGYQFQPPQGPYYQPPQAPPKKRGKVLWIVLAVALVLAVVTCGLISMVASTASQTGTTTTGSNRSSSSSAPAPATGKWTTTHTYSGNGIQKTSTFTAPDDWKLLWTCNPASFSGVGQYNVIVTVTNADGSIADIAVNSLCKKGNVSGSTEEHQGGTVYLDVNSEGSWSLKVQELK